MKRVQRTLVFAVVVLAGGGGAALWTLGEVKTPEERHRKASEEARLFHFGRDHVLGGELFAPSATVAFSRDPAGGWRITAPVSWPADATAIDAMLDRMAGLRLDLVVTEDATAEELRTTGLERPRVRLDVQLKDGPRHLAVGTKNALQDMYPVTDASKKKIGLTEPGFYWSLDRPLSDFREERLFAVPEEDVERLTVRGPSGEVLYTLTRAEAGWTVAGPGAAPEVADAGTISMLLVRITKHLKAKDFLTDAFDPAAMAARFGLDRPTLTLELETAGGRRVGRFGLAKQEHVAALTPVVHLEGTQTVAQIEGTFQEELTKVPADFRDRTISRYAPEAVKKVALYMGNDNPIIMEKRGDDWAIVLPQPHPAKAWRVDALIRAFTLLRADRIYQHDPTKKQLSEWLLDPPSRRLVFYDAAGQVMGDVRIGKYATDSEIFVMQSGAKRADVVTDQRLRVLPAKLDDLIDEERGAPKP